MLLFRLIGDQLGPLGWSLYHFLWQGMLVASLYSLACLICARDMRRRYVLACLFLGVALLLPAWQVWMILNRHHGVSLGIGPPETLLPWMTWIALFLLCIAGTLSVRTLVAAHQLRRVWLDAASENLQLNLAAHEVARQLRVTETPRIVLSTAAGVMAVIGAAHPVIVVPTQMPNCLTEAQFRALLAHEIAHVSRRDPVVNFGLSILESLIFFHPAAAWLAGEVRITREYCCDDVAVQSSGDALAYARGLTTLAKMPGLNTRAALSANGGDLKARVVRLLSRESLSKEAFSNGKRFIFWVAGAGILVGVSKLLCRLM